MTENSVADVPYEYVRRAVRCRTSPQSNFDSDDGLNFTRLVEAAYDSPTLGIKIKKRANPVSGKKYDH